MGCSSSSLEQHEWEPQRENRCQETAHPRLPSEGLHHAACSFHLTAFQVPFNSGTPLASSPEQVIEPPSDILASSSKLPSYLQLATSKLRPISVTLPVEMAASAALSTGAPKYTQDPSCVIDPVNEGEHLNFPDVADTLPSLSYS